jgi:hypothetical protein
LGPFKVRTHNAARVCQNIWNYHNSAGPQLTVGGDGDRLIGAFNYEIRIYLAAIILIYHSTQSSWY